MTEEQRKYVFEVADEIKRYHGKHYEVFASKSIVRIEDSRDRKNYRMMTVLDGSSKQRIRDDMINLVDQLEGRK